MSKFPVLMYHNLCSDPSASFGLTISSDRFETQMKYLVKEKYHFFFASEIIKIKHLPKKSIVITFDDVTQNQLEFAIPILIKYGLKATFFIPFGYIGKTDLWNKSTNYSPKKIMTIEQLKSLDSKFIELGLHTFLHEKLSELSNNQIQKDFLLCFEVIKNNDLKVFKSIAYPYGDYPKSENAKRIFFDILQKNAIQLGFRIGNRVNKFPIENPFEIQRIDVKGTISLLSFKWKINHGKGLLF